eukprot:scpid29783/ scgid2383/ Tyrosine-protein kinase Mer; Proto-oncogene c-Mer; Receptor tyrosine kinase MerTK
MSVGERTRRSSVRVGHGRSCPLLSSYASGGVRGSVMFGRELLSTASVALVLVLVLLVSGGNRQCQAFDICMNQTFFRVLELGIPNFGVLALADEEDVCADWTDRQGGVQFLDATQELYLFGQKSQLLSTVQPLLYLHTYPMEEVRYNVTWSAFHPRDVDNGLALVYQKSPWSGYLGPDQYLNLSLAFSCTATDKQHYTQIFLTYNITTNNTATNDPPTHVSFYLFFQFICNDTNNIDKRYFFEVPFVHPVISFSPQHLHRTELLAVMAVLAVLVLLAVLAIVYFECCFRQRWLDKHMKDTTGKDSGMRSGAQAISEEGQSVGSVPFEGLQLHPDDIILGQEIGKGAFGVVFEGYLHGERVAVKTLKCGSDISSKQLYRFLEEAHVMAQFQHPNILNLVGICLESAAPQIVVPYMQNGDLHSYLKLFNPIFSPGAVELRFEQLFEFALQVALGMSYLGKRNFVHRDLAARNCMLNSDMVVKVGDFGLGRDVQDESYYKVSTEFMLPVKWMALESLQYYKFTTQSDVWSYGIVLWELMSLGQVPYAGVANHEILEHLSEGNRLVQPKSCPDRVYSLMLNCWAGDALDRPLFSQILAALRSIDQSTYDLMLCKPLYLHHPPESIDMISHTSDVSVPLTRLPTAAGKGSSSIGGSEASTPMTESALGRTAHTLAAAVSSSTAATFKVCSPPAKPQVDEASRTA